MSALTRNKKSEKQRQDAANQEYAVGEGALIVIGAIIGLAVNSSGS